MTLHYIRRSLEPVLANAAREFPAVVLTGPRQSGKTTLLREVFATEFRYASLDLPDVQNFAFEDPRGFLHSYPAPLILDEIQYAPDLLPYIRDNIDRNRTLAGQYILSGSQNILLSERVTESLAGRAAVLRLLPLSRREIDGSPLLPFAWEGNASESIQPQQNHLELWNGFLRGGYPELASQPERDVQAWHSSYIQTYLERDVRTLRQVGDLTQFQNFLRLLAARNAQLLNLTEISRDLGLAVNSIKAWLSVLEASYQITILRPYFANVGKRLAKTPKVYFSDVGTLCFLTGLREPEHAFAGPMGGAILETAVLAELMRTITHRGTNPLVYFWRTTAGTEVDFIVDSDKHLVPIEVKLSATPRRAMVSSIKKFQRDLPIRTSNGYLVHPGEARLSLGDEITALPYSQL